MTTSTSEMINFRVRKADVARLKAAVERSGLSRSEFIRQAVTREITRYTKDSTPLQAAAGRGPEVKTATGKMPFEKCPKADQCRVEKLVTGVKICHTCHVKM